MVKLYMLLLILANPVVPSGDIKIRLAFEGLFVSPEPYGVVPVTFIIFFSSVPSHLIETRPFEL